MPISCFGAETPILTKSGFKYISEIVVGDKVLTHTGNYKTVVATRKIESDDIYELVVNKRATKLTVTGNHLIYTNLGWVRVDELDKFVHYVACNHKVNIVENDYIIQITENTKYGNGKFERAETNLKVAVTDDVAWALGFWFAEGSTSSTGTLKVTNNNKEICQKWVDTMTTAFGVPGKVRANRTWFDGEINSKTLCEFFDSEFGKGCKTKTLTDWIVELPKEKLQKFYAAFYLGDGCKTTNAPMIELANPKLVAGLSTILNKLGVKHSLQLAKKTSTATNGIISVSIGKGQQNNKNSPRCGLLMHDGLMYNCIDSVTKVEKKIDVYDIQVEDDESFSAAGIVAHNCFLSSVDDSLAGIIDHEAESSWLAAMGGGLGASWSALRTNKTKTSRGGESTGAIPFIAQFDRKVLAYRQAGTRRAAYAAYIDISHPEIVEFVSMRKPTGGAAERKSLNLHHAVNISDAFMDKLYAADDSWELIDPHSKKVTDVVSARELWQAILTMRVETGEPYIHFIDTSNRALPQEQKNLNLLINNSNLCSEIVLPTSAERTAVCCLSSVNLEKYDEWKNTTMVADLIKMLDNVLDTFIEAANLSDSAKTSIRRATFSASRERSLGLGAMGFHAYLQKNLIPMESEEAAKINEEIFASIREQAEKATEELGRIKGSCPDYVEGGGTGVRRNMHLIAIAPNASSSILCGNTSPSIEPYSTNSFSQRTENGTNIFKNPHLTRLLVEKGMTEDEIKSVWRSIAAKKGSCQHLTCLSDHEKAVFKTSFEISQKTLVKLAADRQKHIDQAQSLNLFFKAPIAVEELHDTHYSAWKLGVKTLYYMRTSIERSGENIGQKIERAGEGLTTDKNTDTFVQTQFKTVTKTGFEIECVGCEG
ncbi:MAG: ribonucleoside-diphosphate reductase subunit alpha [Caulobacteraceae bacterium]|nr:ribonucleoside-diphosphate reductase subunit alpha [Caulobacteraceae bacterium]